MSLIKITIYKNKSGKEPFSEWLEDLDQTARSCIKARLRRVSFGNFGDCKMLKSGNGVSELRINYGPGYRVYYGMYERTIILLLLGGEKSGQNKDIEKAKSYWNEYKKSEKEC